VLKTGAFFIGIKGLTFPTSWKLSAYFEIFEGLWGKICPYNLYSLVKVAKA
jgi:hypothetical protein